MSATIISPTSTVPKAANNLRKIGVSVFPIAHQQKTPSTSWKRFQTALPTEAQIQQWFSDKPTNYGIATGAFSNLVVLDADDSKAVDYIEQNFPSPWTQTTARGKQFFYRHPGGVVPNKTHVNGVAIDVRGDGGYVVGPGSIHPSGATYTVEQAWTGTPKELPELPLHLLSEPFATKKEFSFPTGGDRSALIERGRAYLASIEPPTVGNGSDALTYRVCCRLVGSGATDIGLTIEEALPLLMEWQPDFDESWFKEKLENALEYGRNEDKNTGAMKNTASVHNKEERAVVLKNLAGLDPIDYELELKRLSEEWGVSKRAIQAEVVKQRQKRPRLSDGTERILRLIKAKKGLFVRNGDSYSILVENTLIPINADLENPKLAKLFQSVREQENFTSAGKKTVQELLIAAHESADGMAVKKFSAFHENAVWIPTVSGLIVLTGEAVTKELNGRNKAKLWLEHPNGDPLKFDETVDVQAGLRRFEELLVNIAATKTPEMRWFLAMNFGLFPFVRSKINRRMIALLQGPSQNGKTTAMERYSYFHGLGPVNGNTSVPAYINNGDVGFLAMDNKEARNMRNDFTDFLLFLATGGKHAKCFSDGTLRPLPDGRPVGAVTSIEGFSKNELQLRTAVIDIQRNGKAFDEAPITEAILQERHTILSALLKVLQQYLQCGPRRQASPADSTFPDHWEALCRLLQAYAAVSGRKEGWAAEIIAVWRGQLSKNRKDEDDHDESEYETAIISTLEKGEYCDSGYNSITATPHVYENVEGTLYIVKSWDCLLDYMSQNNRTRVELPKSGKGLRARITSDAASFQTMKQIGR